MPRSKHFLFASCGPQIPFTWRNAYWGLNLPKVGTLLVPSIPVKLSHMDISVEIWYKFQLDMYHFPFPAYCSYKKTKTNKTNRRYSGEITVTKISSTVYWVSSQWELWRETPRDMSWHFLQQSCFAFRILKLCFPVRPPFGKCNVYRKYPYPPPPAKEGNGNSERRGGC